MRRFHKSWLFQVILVLLGFSTALVLQHFPYFIQILKSIDWESLAFWLILFLGALIPIIINYLSIRRQEVLKLKGVFLADNAMIIRAYKEWSILFRVTVITKKKREDLCFHYECSSADSTATYLRTLHVLSDKEVFSKFKLSWYEYKEKLSQLCSDAIDMELEYINNYLLNAELIFEDLPSALYEDYGIALKNDFFDLSYALDKVIEIYKSKCLFMLDVHRDRITQNPCKQSIDERLLRTNLQKYRSEFIQIIETRRSDFAKAYTTLVHPNAPT